MHFQNYWLQKTLLDKCLKSIALEHRSALNMLKRPKYCWTLQGRIFSNFLITLRELELENVSLSGFLNLGTVF